VKKLMNGAFKAIVLMKAFHPARFEQLLSCVLPGNTDFNDVSSDTTFCARQSLNVNGLFECADSTRRCQFF
jgi:hypothetical protein